METTIQNYHLSDLSKLKKRKLQREEVNMAEWLKGCEVCNAGLCKEMSRLINDEGLSQRKAAQKLVDEQKEKFDGKVLYSVNALKNRYQLHTGKREPNKKVAHNEPKIKPDNEEPLFNRDGSLNSKWSKAEREFDAETERLKEQFKERTDVRVKTPKEM